MKHITKSFSTIIVFISGLLWKMWNQSTLDCVQDKRGGRTVGYLPDTLPNVRNAFSHASAKAKNISLIKKISYLSCCCNRE